MQAFARSRHRRDDSAPIGYAAGAWAISRRCRCSCGSTSPFSWFSRQAGWAFSPGRVATLVAALGVHLTDHHSLDLAITALEAAVLAWYLYVALGTVFGLSMLRRLLTVPALVAALYVILKAYNVVVFAVTMYSI